MITDAQAKRYIKETQDFLSTNQEDTYKLLSILQMCDKNHELHIVSHKSTMRLNGKEEDIVIFYPHILSLPLKTVLAFRRANNIVYFCQPEEGKLVEPDALLSNMYAQARLSMKELTKKFGKVAVDVAQGFVITRNIVKDIEKKYFEEISN